MDQPRMLDPADRWAALFPVWAQSGRRYRKARQAETIDQATLYSPTCPPCDMRGATCVAAIFAKYSWSDTLDPELLAGTFAGEVR